MLSVVLFIGGDARIEGDQEKERSHNLKEWGCREVPVLLQQLLPSVLKYSVLK